MQLKNIEFKQGNLSGITLYMDPEYAKYVFSQGDTDREMMDCIEQDSPLGKNIFDVGAFIGSSSLVFSKYIGEKGKVIAFEPNPFNIKKIEKNFSLNPELAKKIKVYNYALADVEGKMSMALSESVDSGMSSTSRLDIGHPTIHSEDLPGEFIKVEVLVKTLDSFVDEVKVIPNIIKVDIEGAEDKFLLGAKRTIKKYKPVLYIEIHSEYCALKCFEILLSYGYSVHILKEEQDNRVMVKAVYVKNLKTYSLEDREKIAQQSVETSINLLNGVNVLIKDNIDLKNILREEHRKLTKMSEELNIELAEKKVYMKELDEKINSMENSRSWKVTKPFRFLISKLQRFK